GVELAAGRVAGEREVGARPAGGHDLAVALEGQAVDGVVEAGGSSKETGQHQAVAVERDVPGAGGRVTGQREVVVGVRSGCAACRWWQRTRPPPQSGERTISPRRTPQVTVSVPATKVNG